MASNSGDDEVRFRGKTYERIVFPSGIVAWSCLDKRVGSLEYEGDWELNETGNRRFSFIRGNIKLIKKLEWLFASKRLWELDNEEPEHDENHSEPGDSTMIPRKRDAVSFQSIDPRYALKLSITTSRQNPNRVNLYVYIDPKREQRFYCVEMAQLEIGLTRLLREVKYLRDRKS